MYALSCSSPNAPIEQGSVVFRFEPASDAAMSLRAGAAAPTFDSVAVRIFRSGSPITQEVRQGAPIGGSPVEMTIGCIAEANKRVSVELFTSGVMQYQGVAENVDVVAGKKTDVLVDAYPFYVPSLTVTPGILYDGSSFQLSWPGTVGAQTYVVQSSSDTTFSSIEWQQSLTDTFTTAVLPPGSHYFRVAPRTPYAIGTFAGPEFSYVLGGSASVVITGLSAVGTIPGDLVSIYGENLDFPDTQAAIGTDAMKIVSASWGELVVRMPRVARSGYVTVGSSLGADTSSDPLISLRIAFVSAAGLLTGSFGEVLWRHGDDIDWSGIAYIPLPELDSRDMSVFDVIMVASDTGTDVTNWGGGVPARVIAITSSGANVLAIGDGGGAFLRLAVSAFAGVTVRVASLTSCYASSPSAPLFTTPHPVTSGGLPQWVDMCQKPERCITFDISSFSKPAGVSLYATSQIGSDRWALADIVITDATQSRRYMLWGFAADPKEYTSQGQDCLSNAVFQLYKERAAPVPASP